MTPRPSDDALEGLHGLEGLDDPLIDLFGMLLESHNEVVHGLQQSSELPTPWLGVLIRLSRSPDCRLRMTELARDMTMSTSGLTRLIDRVEESGQVRREACPGDRRGLLAVLTDPGRKVLDEQLPPHLADLRAVLGGALSPTQVAQLTDLLRLVRDHARNLDQS